MESDPTNQLPRLSKQTASIDEKLQSTEANLTSIRQDLGRLRATSAAASILLTNSATSGANVTGANSTGADLESGAGTNGKTRSGS